MDRPINCVRVNSCTGKVRVLGAYNTYDTDLAKKANFFAIVYNINQ